MKLYSSSPSVQKALNQFLRYIALPSALIFLVLPWFLLDLISKLEYQILMLLSFIIPGIITYIYLRMATLKWFKHHIALVDNKKELYERSLSNGFYVSISSINEFIKTEGIELVDHGVTYKDDLPELHYYKNIVLNKEFIELSDEKFPLNEIDSCVFIPSAYSAHASGNSKAPMSNAFGRKHSHRIRIRWKNGKFKMVRIKMKKKEFRKLESKVYDYIRNNTLGT